MVKCWICGGKAESGEHAIKKSDLDILFDDVNQHNPIYTKSKAGRALKIGSLKSKKLHLKSKICNFCNSTRTQPFDNSWKNLSNHLHSISDKYTKKIKLTSVLQTSMLSSKTYLQLYFLKLVGCIIKETAMPVDLYSFSNSILNKSAHPGLYLDFGFIHRKKKKNIAMLTLVDFEEHGGGIHGASWVYIVGEVFTQIYYISKPEYEKAMSGLWHPKNQHKYLRLRHYYNA